jgi:hypothetical protein
MRSVPVILQALLFILVLMAPAFLREHRVPFGAWWPWIVVPVFLQPALIFLPAFLHRRGRGRWFLSVYVLAALFLGSLVFPISRFLAPYKSAYPVVQALKSRLPAGREVYQYGMSLYGIDFYGKMRTPVVDDIGEVRFGSERLPREERTHYFLTSEEFFRLFHERGDIYCVTDRKESVERLKKEAPGTRVLWDNGEFYLLHMLRGGNQP